MKSVVVQRMEKEIVQEWFRKGSNPVPGLATLLVVFGQAAEWQHKLNPAWPSQNNTS